MWNHLLNQSLPLLYSITSSISSKFLPLDWSITSAAWFCIAMSSGLLTRVADPDPVGSGGFAWIRSRFSNFSIFFEKGNKTHRKIDGKCSELSGSVSGSGLKKFNDPDPVCPERLDPDPVNIRPDPQPCCWLWFCCRWSRSWPAWRRTKICSTRRKRIRSALPITSLTSLPLCLGCLVSSRLYSWVGTVLMLPGLILPR